MNMEKIKPILVQIAIVAAGVLVANQIQCMLDKNKVIKPSQA